MMRKIVAAAAVAAAAVLGPQAALAAPATAHHAQSAAARERAAQERAWLAREVQGLLKYNPGAVQVSADAVRYKGAILGITPQKSSATPDSESGVCPNNNVCLFWDANFNITFGGRQSGPWIDFYKCDVNYDLYNYKVSTGASWGDETSSIDYPGSASSNEAKFNHDGDWWLYLYRDHYLRNLTADGGPNPAGNSNDWITGLYAC